MQVANNVPRIPDCPVARNVPPPAAKPRLAPTTLVLTKQTQGQPQAKPAGPTPAEKARIFTWGGMALAGAGVLGLLMFPIGTVMGLFAAATTAGGAGMSAFGGFSWLRQKLGW